MPSDTSSSDTRSGPLGLPRWAAWGIGFLIFMLLAYGAGYLSGSAPVDDLADRLELAVTEVEEAELVVDRLRSEVSAHEALALMYETMLAVDARNFGIGNERLEQAEAALVRTEAQLLGVDVSAFRSIVADIAAMDVRVAEDLAAQRTTLAELAGRLSDLLDG